MNDGMKKAAVLCILRSGDELLLLKRTKKLHYGQYVPVGGHIEPHESAHDAAIREVHEETGAVLQAIRFCGILQDTAPTDYNWISFVYVAEVERFAPPECREGVLEWLPLSHVPALPTPPTDQFIYRLVLQGRPFVLDAQYDADIELLRLEEEIAGEVLYRRDKHAHEA